MISKFIPEKKKELVKLEYPVARLSKSNGDIILFTSSTKGICIYSKSGDTLGTYNSEYITAEDETNWKEVKGKVEITL